MLEESVDDMWCRVQTLDGKIGLCPQAFLVINSAAPSGSDVILDENK